MLPATLVLCSHLPRGLYDSLRTTGFSVAVSKIISLQVGQSHRKESILLVQEEQKKGGKGGGEVTM